MAERRVVRARRCRLVRGLASVVGGLVLWELVGRFVVTNPILFAPLSKVLAVGWTLTASGELGRHLAVSMAEFAGGFALAALVGVAFGLLMAVNRFARDIFDPWVSFLYSSPLVALMPLLIVVFGLGYASKIAIVFIVSVFPILLSTYSGVSTIDRHLVDVGRAFNASRLQRFTKILLPAALPAVVVGLRLGIGRGLTGVVVGELFAANGGVGFLIATAGQSFDTPVVLFGVLVLSLVGLILTEALHALERRIAPWRATVAEIS
ncbi:ABC transporter permease [Xanthobacter sp. V4C-4]|uniref:ABC transporter permease n=1 Tax=Xanthobacter cornucopiae TaxID=3119924 RepID=UPI003727F900